jgi:NADP-dependent aldehyde dehydrogenase
MAQQILINGQWCDSQGTETFKSVNPRTTEQLEDEYPVSPWNEIDDAVTAAYAASVAMRGWPGSRFADFLDAYADGIDQRADSLIDIANQETALPVEPRLKNVELPRTTNQLRQAGAAARDGSWSTVIIDTQTNIRAMFGAIGPVSVFGPNNFPFAFNSIAGGDFAAAIAAGNPVIAKGHSAHPGTTRLFAEAAHEAAQATKMPAGFVQLIYRMSHEDGCRFVSHPLMGATGYTGSRSAGLRLKEAADKTGKPIYVELSSINPVFILPGALAEGLEERAAEFSGSCLMGTGQFCTNPGLVVLVAGDSAQAFTSAVAKHFSDAPIGTFLGEGVQRSFASGIAELTNAGAQIVVGGEPGGGTGFSHQNTLLRVDGDAFLKKPAALQAEAFGNSSLFVIANDVAQLNSIAEALEGNLTGSVYSHTGGDDDEIYDSFVPALTQKVGRLLNDKMPTGVAVSPAMNHGGPFPATGHPTFTAVGMPTSIHRFSMLHSYDNIRPHRLPEALQDKNPTGCWRRIDGSWTQDDI